MKNCASYYKKQIRIMIIQPTIFVFKKTIFALSVLFFCSCATLFNKTYTTINIHTSSPAKIVVSNDTIKTIENSAAFIVERSKNPLLVESITDSIKKTYSVKPILSTMFYNNFLCLPYGISGAVIDLFSEKKFNYPAHIFIHPMDQKNKYKILGNYSHKGEMYLNFSIPEVNYIYQYTQYGGYMHNGGCMGISGGIDYYHKPLQFVNLSGAITLTYEAPIPLPLEYFGPYDIAYSKYISVSNNHRFWFFSAGYGLSFSENVWKYFNNNSWDMSSLYTVVKKNLALGFVFPFYIKISEPFHIGFVYRPSFYRPYSPQPFKYEHLMSLDLAWKFRIKNR